MPLNLRALLPKVRSRCRLVGVAMAMTLRSVTAPAFHVNACQQAMKTEACMTKILRGNVMEGKQAQLIYGTGLLNGIGLNRG